MLKIVKKTKIVKDEKTKEERELTFNNIYLFGVCVKAVNPSDNLKLYYAVKGYLANDDADKE